jgi:malate synthase
VKPEYLDILTVDALRFVAALHEKFEGTRKLLLNARDQRQKQISQGVFPDFLPETKSIREVIRSSSLRT